MIDILLWIMVAAWCVAFVRLILWPTVATWIDRELSRTRSLLQAQSLMVDIRRYAEQHPCEYRRAVEFYYDKGYAEDDKMLALQKLAEAWGDIKTARDTDHA